MRLITIILFFWTTLLHAQNSEWQPIIDDIIADGRAATIVVGFLENSTKTTSTRTKVIERTPDQNRLRVTPRIED